MSKWIGYAVSVNCGEPLGCYQGTILEADGNTITLTKAFRNGFPYPKSQVTLNAADIKDLKIIEERVEPSGQAHSTVAVTKSNKKVQRATVCENLQANPSSSGNQSQCSNTGRSTSSQRGAPAGTGSGNGTAPPRSKPIDIQQANRNRNNNHAGSYGNAGSTPKGRGGGGGTGVPQGGSEKARRRNEACFGDAAHPPQQQDFDFEGNLALFDKRALWEQMNSHKPDLVRQTDEAAGKYRHDENVLGGGTGGGGGGGGGGAATRGIVVPDELRAHVDYVTDDGLRVPAASAQLRARLWARLHGAGVGAAALALLARGAADVALRLVGGGRRLEARNAHQAPCVAVIVAAAAADHAAAGLTAARLLAAHGVQVACYIAPEPTPLPPCEYLQRERAALSLSSVERCQRLDRLPKPDLVLLALHDPRAIDDDDQHLSEVLSWSRGCRAPCVAVEPAGGGWGGAVSCRAAVVSLLPPALAASLGRVYLCCVAAPQRIFADAGVAYKSPFGAGALIALHPSDE